MKLLHFFKNLKSKREFLLVLILIILTYFFLVKILDFDKNIHEPTIPTAQIRNNKFHREDIKVLSSQAENLSNEGICVNVGYFLNSYCGSGGCFWDDSIEKWINNARAVIHSRGVTAYEFEDSGIDCSEAVVKLMDEITVVN